MDLYFQRHDGQAVTCDDFVSAMEDASAVDLSQFRLWYAQAGTPDLAVEEHWDERAKALDLIVEQKIPPTPGQPQKRPMAIPLAIGILGEDGKELPTQLDGERSAVSGTRVLSLRNNKDRFRFVGLPSRPAVSLLRGFSAPVRLKPQRRERLMFLFAHDTDPCARWDAGQQLATSLLLEMADGWRSGQKMALDPLFIEAFSSTLADSRLDPALKAEALSLPSESYLADQMQVADTEAVFMAREEARRAIAAALGHRLLESYESNREAGPHRLDPEAMGRRALKNAALAYLAAPKGHPRGLSLAFSQYSAGGNMTDVLAALSLLADRSEGERDQAFAEFYEKWRAEALVIDKWFALQATSPLPDTIERVRELLVHPAFTYTTPNRVYALIASFAASNPVRFHAEDGSGYRFLGRSGAGPRPRESQVAHALLTPSAAGAGRPRLGRSS